MKRFSLAFQWQSLPQSETVLVWWLVCFLVVTAHGEYLVICCEKFNAGRWTAVVMTQEAVELGICVFS